MGIIVTLGGLFSSVHSLPTLWPHGLQHARPPCPSPTPRVYWNSCPLNWWCHPTISSSVVPFFSCLQSFPASGSFQLSQFFASGGPSIGVSASTSGSSWFTYCGSLAWRIFSITSTSVWDECNCAVVWAFFGIAFLWDWNENWPFLVLWLDVTVGP